MRVTFGALVKSSDHHIVGTVDRLVLDPASGELKLLAINVGLLLPHDLETPAVNITAADDEAIHLAVTALQLESFPRFDEARYTPAGTPIVEPANPIGGAVILPTDIFYGAGGHEQTTRAQETARLLAQTYSEADIQNAVLADGAVIRSHDGQHLGDLHALDFDIATRHLQAITLRHGWFMSERIDLPARLLAAVDDGAIHLNVNASSVQLWASLEPGLEVWTVDRVCLGSIQQRRLDELLVGGDGDHPLIHVPMQAVERVSQNRLILNEDHARALLWPTSAPADQVQA